MFSQPFDVVPIQIFEPIQCNARLGDGDARLLYELNEIIRFINNFHYKKLQPRVEKLKVLEQKYLELRSSDEKTTASPELLDFAKNIAKEFRSISEKNSRARFIEMLGNNQSRLRELLRRHLTNKNENEEVISQKIATLQQIFDEFSEYRRFAHLMADELYIVAIIVERFAVAMQNSLKQIKDAQLKEIIGSKIRELENSKSDIKKCMAKHIAIKKSYVEPKDPPPPTLDASVTSGDAYLVDGYETVVNKDHNDIVLHLKQRLNELFDKEVTKVEGNEWTDISLCYAAPPLPIDVQNKASAPVTIESKFRTYIEGAGDQNYRINLLILCEKVVNNATWARDLAAYGISCINSPFIARTVDSVSVVITNAYNYVHNLLNQPKSARAIIEDYENHIEILRLRQEARKGVLPKIIVTDVDINVDDQPAPPPSAPAAAASSNLPADVKEPPVPPSVSTIETSAQARSTEAPASTSSDMNRWVMMERMDERSQNGQEERKPSPDKKPEKKTRNSVTFFLPGSNENSPLRSNEVSLLESWKKQLRALRKELTNETERWEKISGCFCGLFNSKVGTKKAKIKALNKLIHSFTLKGLQEKALVYYMEEKNSNVIAGFNSRTKQLLYQILEACAIDSQINPGNQTSSGSGKFKLKPVKRS